MDNTHKSINFEQAAKSSAETPGMLSTSLTGAAACCAGAGVEAA